jgi:roadblock/LC7 domain-containing protein
MLFTLGAAAAAAVMGSISSLDYTALIGPTWSPVAALVIGSGLAYAVRETAFGKFLRDNGQDEAADLIDPQP